MIQSQVSKILIFAAILQSSTFVYSYAFANETSTAGAQQESASEVSFEPTDIYYEVIAEAKAQSSPISPLQLEKASLVMAKALHRWNPNHSLDEIAASLYERSSQQGIETGFIKPALVFLDMTYFHNQPELAQIALKSLNELNPKVSGILELRLSLKASDDEAYDSLPILSRPSSLMGAGNRPSLDQILFGNGSESLKTQVEKSQENVVR